MSVRSEAAAELTQFAERMEAAVEDWPGRQVLAPARAAVDEAAAILRDAAAELVTIRRERVRA